MNKFIIDGLVIVGIGVVGGIGFVGYKVNDINKKVNTLMSKIDEAGKELPKPFIQTNVLEKGLFSSKGVYKIVGEKDDKNVEFKITYEIEHGILDIFKDKYPIIGQADLKTSEGIEKILQNNGTKFLNITGNYIPDGELDLKAVSDTIATKGMKEMLDISPVNLALNLNTISGDTKMSIDIKDVKTKNVKMNNLSLGFEASMNDAFKGKGFLKIGLFKSKFGTIDSLSTEYSGKKDKDMYNFNFKSEVKDVAILTEEKKSAKIDISIDMKDSVLRKIYEKHKKAEETPSMEEKRKDGLEILTNGFNFKINELSYKDNKDKLLTKGFITIDEQENKSSIDLENFLKYNIDISSEGDMNKSVVFLVKALFTNNDDLDFNAIEETPLTPMNQSFSYKKGEMKVNGKEVDQNNLAIFVSKLKDLSDGINGVEKVEPEPESDGDEEMQSGENNSIKE